jgi:urease accessory protein
MLATLLVLADGRLPSGSHAHSGGVEAAVAAGRVTGLESLGAFLRGRLATSGVVAAAVAAAACAAAVDNRRRMSDPAGILAPPDGRGWVVDNRAKLSHPGGRVGPPEQGREPAGAQNGQSAAWSAELDAAMEARTPSPALRKASRAQGRALLRAGRAMWPVPDIGREPHQPVALGAVAAAAGLGPREAAVAAAYGTLTGPATAGVRLLSLDPYGVHALLAGLADDCDRVADAAATHARDPFDRLPAASAPLLDIGAEHHATWEVRLFAS